ncbi:hypothetical protein BH10ACT11_BH10ACT11_15920 [soil metagenome]
MSDVDRLFDEYRTLYRSGEKADPTGFLDQLEGTDRRELMALIDGFLRTSPGREWSPQQYAGSAAERFVQRTDLSAAVQSGWRQLLPALRHRAELKRSELTERLAEGLGVGGSREKVGEYYHQMEWGSLPADGVADRVLEVLGGILGTTAEALRVAGSTAAPGDYEVEASRIAFTRTALPDERYDSFDGDLPITDALESPALPARGAGSPARAEPWDEVDELFRGPRPR